jgi:phosphoserine phosphatase RsbU/P
VDQNTIPLQVVQTALRTHLPFIGIASVVLVAGVCSVLLWRLRPRERLFLWVGMFSILYGVRLFLENDLIGTASGLNGRTIYLWTQCLTYLISIPYALFAVELYGHGWKNSIQIWIWVEAAFALMAIPFVILRHDFSLASSLNNNLVIVGTLIVLMHVVLQRKSSESFAKGLTWPLIIFGIFVLLTNRDIHPGGIKIEPIGFLVLLGGLVFTAARLAVVRERKLLEVEQELATARRIQNSTIPQSAPAISGLTLATRYQPMTSVAGDFFDFLETGKGCLTILVADVSGHGVPAALVASMLKVCFAAQRQHASNPAEVLAGLNTMLRGSLGGQYVTAACAAIDLTQRTITYAGAGHPPSLLFRGNRREVVPLAENGLFIGPFPQATYANISTSFESGDKLLLYTDGILEATGSDGQEFGQENLEALLIHTADLEPAEFITELFRKIETPVQQDDLTAVLTRFA